MKKLVLIPIIALLLSGAGLVATVATYPVSVNGERLDATVLNHNGTTYLPLKVVGQALGADVSWTGGSVEIETVDIEALKEACVSIFGNNGKTTTQGSGVYIDYGEVLTAYHVIDGATRYGSMEEEYPSILDKDKALDVALLKPKSEIKPVKIGDSDEMDTGDKVIIIGVPSGVEDTVKYATVKWERNGEIVLNGALEGGYSGSPVFDISGSLIGIAVASDTNFNETYITPINDIREAL
jgi:S1-C subfamily serine protease